MTTYLRSETIRDAVNRLVVSRAQRGFTDFLILKRALKRAGSANVPFSMKDENFTGAIRELAGVVGREGTAKRSGNGLPPFFKVFGIAQPVSEKILTNGPADTLSGPAWQPVVQLEGQRPRRGGLRPGNEAHLENLLQKREGEKPSLGDAAIWFFRKTDLASKGVPTNGTGKALRESLETAFVSDLGLNRNEIRLLFNSIPIPTDTKAASDLVQPEPASPSSFLPLDETGKNDDVEWPRMNFAFEDDASGGDIHIQFDGSVLLRFMSSLLAKRLTILTGLAGSGKTKVAQAFARWLSPKLTGGETANANYVVVPVGADWTGNENILGYPDGLDSKRYVSRPALEIMLHAAQNTEMPHFLILDEMNLSHVERYFADLLSAIESGEDIPLYQGDERKAGERVVPRQLTVPPNLFVIGTVNVDETTYMFSPKVLDRANVIEFRMERDELENFLAAPKKPDLQKLDGLGAGFGKGFVGAAAGEANVPKAVKTQFESEMLLFFDILHEHGAEFGFRVGHEAGRFLHYYQKLGGFEEGDGDWFDAAFDAVIVQKCLPKLHGSRSSLEGLLWALAWACGAERAGKKNEEFLNECRLAGQAQEEMKFGPEKVFADLAAKKTAARYPLSFEKVIRMWEKLKRDQFVSFAEA